MGAPNLREALADQGIKTSNLRPGSSTKMICPKCGGGIHRDVSLSLTIDADGHGAVANCHRGKCGWTFGCGGAGAKNLNERPHNYRPAPVHAPAVTTKPELLYGFFQARKISAETVDAFGCYVLPGHKFPGEMGVHDAIVFPYIFEKAIVNRKYRAVHSKEITGQDYQALPTLFNFDGIEAPDEVIWVEGEPDVMALHEAGYKQIVTLKDGAPGQLRDESDPRRDGDKRFLALGTHAAKLSEVKKFILAGDMDAPGAVLREELARRLGRHRCWTVAWPEGCKDAGDVLRVHGPARVQECIDGASPYPIDGVYEVTGQMLDDYLERPAPRCLSTGVSTVDEILKLPGEGRVIIVTGFPNSGKTKWTMNVMIHLMDKERRRFAVFSPEMQPFEEFAVQCAEILVGKPARRVWDMPHLQPMDRDSRVRAGDWLRKRMAFLSVDSEDSAPSLDWILDRAKDCVLRLGTTDLLIDPVNEIEQSRGTSTETEFIGRLLQRVRTFGQRHGCNVWIIAHPAKMRPAKPGDKLGAPGPYDISGSAHWANKADVGVTIHTPQDETELHLWKARFTRWGRKGTKAFMQYDRHTGRYSAPAINAADYRRQSGGE